MPSSERRSGSSTKFPSRRRHKKSRKGCLECKRRRIKCDEAKPSCMRCVSLLKKCAYPPETLSTPQDRKDEKSLPSPARSTLSLSPNTTSVLEYPQSSGSSTRPATEIPEPICLETDGLPPLTETDLYHHYLQHTSRTLTHSQLDQGVFEIGMPTLALQSKTVFHSILALSAACMSCDMISRDSPPPKRTVTQVLTTGYWHYNLASERMRESISNPNPLNTGPLLASAALLVPFATASQQINHWMSSRNETKKPQKLLASTPRDVIIIMRGIKATIHALHRDETSPDSELSQETDFPMDCQSLWLERCNPFSGPPPSHTHVMFPILAATSQSAFSKLQQRLESSLLCHNDPCDRRYTHGAFSACANAFEILNILRTNTFSLESPTSPSPSHDVKNLPQVPPWLSSYASRNAIPQPTEPLTRSFLGFLVETPQAYLDLLLPLLDQRLERPLESLPDHFSAAELTKEQALALDIYAHWSVLMFLVEYESWWIGRLPIVTLSGMVNRYGHDFVKRWWPEYGEEQWWPGTMLTIRREIERCR